MPDATLLETSDPKEEAAHGIGYGAIVGLVAGLIAVAVPSADLVLGGVPKEHAEEVEELVRSKHPKVESGDQEPNVPNVSMNFAGVIIAFVGIPSARVTTEILPR